MNTYTSKKTLDDLLTFRYGVGNGRRGPQDFQPSEAQYDAGMSGNCVSVFLVGRSLPIDRSQRDYSGHQAPRWFHVVMEILFHEGCSLPSIRTTPWLAVPGETERATSSASLSTPAANSAPSPPSTSLPGTATSTT